MNYCPECLRREGKVTTLDRLEYKLFGYLACPTPECGFTFTIYDFTQKLPAETST